MGAGLLYLDENEVGAGFSEGYGDRCAYASRRTCNESSLPFKREERGGSHVVTVSELELE